MATNSDMKRIDVLSDSTGETAEKVVRAAMLQFPHSGAQIRLHTRVRTKEAARPILERAAGEGALVVFTVVSPELREYIHVSSYELRVEANLNLHLNRDLPGQTSASGPPLAGGKASGEGKDSTPAEADPSLDSLLSPPDLVLVVSPRRD